MYYLEPVHKRFNFLFLVSLLEAAITKKMDVPLHPYSRLMHQKLTTLFWSLRRLVAAVHEVLPYKKLSRIPVAQSIFTLIRSSKKCAEPLS